MDYKDMNAIGIVRLMLTDGVITVEQAAKYFPELAESEDERIRKHLIKHFSAKSKEKWNGISVKDILAWLEKQGEQKQELLTKEKALKNSPFVEQNPANSIWHEMTENPEGNENDRTLVVFEDGYSTTSNALLHIGFGTSKQYKWAYVNDILRLTSKTKQGEQKPVNKAKIGEKYVCVNCPRYTCFITGCVYEVKDSFMAALIGLCSNCFELYEVVDEQQVEPKFKVGDWIVRELDNTCYKIKNCILNVTTNKYGYGLTNGGYISSQDADFYHLWTIQDAKDGDVLCTYECGKPKIVFILKGAPEKPYVLGYHCFYNIMYPHFEFDSEKGCLAPNEEDLKPATKEQRDLLFQKVREAGYEWDAEKKELKKIVAPKFEVGDTMRTLQEVANGVTDGMPVVVSIDEEYYHCTNELIAIKDQDSYEYPPMNRIQKTAEWSEENKSYLLDFTRWFEQKAKAYDINLPMRGFDICAFCKEIIERLQICENLVWENIEETQRTNAIIMLKEGACRVYTQDSIDKCVDWLKSLKCRVQPQPKQEWSEEDENNINSIVSRLEVDISYWESRSKTRTDEDKKLIGWLKSLRPQDTWKPSDEQMEALEHFIVYHNGSTNYAKDLEELRLQLKKLREK